MLAPLRIERMVSSTSPQPSNYRRAHGNTVGVSRAWFCLLLTLSRSARLCDGSLREAAPCSPIVTACCLCRPFVLFAILHWIPKGCRCYRRSSRGVVVRGLAMGKSRLEAFSDGVIAIIITIMVLELKAPHEASLDAL